MARMAHAPLPEGLAVFRERLQMQVWSFLTLCVLLSYHHLNATRFLITGLLIQVLHNIMFNALYFHFGNRKYHCAFAGCIELTHTVSAIHCSCWPLGAPRAPRSTFFFFLTALLIISSNIFRWEFVFSHFYMMGVMFFALLISTKFLRKKQKDIFWTQIAVTY